MAIKSTDLVKQREGKEMLWWGKVRLQKKTGDSWFLFISWPLDPWKVKVGAGVTLHDRCWFTTINIHLPPRKLAYWALNWCTRIFPTRNRTDGLWHIMCLSVPHITVAWKKGECLKVSKDAGRPETHCCAHLLLCMKVWHVTFALLYIHPTVFLSDECFTCNSNYLNTVMSQ